VQTVAEYRGAVLRSIQEVEDGLADLRWLSKEVQSMSTAATAAQKALDASLTLYKEGATSYLDVITAQTAALDAQDSLVALKARRLQAYVALMLALGGGWLTHDIEETEPPPELPIHAMSDSGVGK
jgi:outer membrane protein TolC